MFPKEKLWIVWLALYCAYIISPVRYDSSLSMADKAMDYFHKRFPHD